MAFLDLGAISRDQVYRLYRNDIEDGITIMYTPSTEEWYGKVYYDEEIDPCELFRLISISFTPATPRKRTCKDGQVKIGEKCRIPAHLYHRVCDLICEIESQLMNQELDAEIKGVE